MTWALMSDGMLTPDPEEVTKTETHWRSDSWSGYQDGWGEDGQVIGEEEWAHLDLGQPLPPILIKSQFNSYMPKE